MRTRLILATAAAALGLGLSQPASAGGWDDGYCCGGYYGGTVYVHHHVYFPPRYKHVYHFHRPGPRHVHVVHYAGYPYPSYRSRGYFAPRYYYRWRGHGWDW